MLVQANLGTYLWTMGSIERGKYLFLPFRPNTLGITRNQYFLMRFQNLLQVSEPLNNKQLLQYTVDYLFIIMNE